MYLLKGVIAYIILVVSAVIIIAVCVPVAVLYYSISLLWLGYLTIENYILKHKQKDTWKDVTSERNSKVTYTDNSGLGLTVEHKDDYTYFITDGNKLSYIVPNE